VGAAAHAWAACTCMVPAFSTHYEGWCWEQVGTGLRSVYQAPADLLCWIVLKVPAREQD
jgi:hypothetical protein